MHGLRGAATLISGAARLVVAGKHPGQRDGMAAGRPPGETRLIGWLLQTLALNMIFFANVRPDHGILSAETLTAPRRFSSPRSSPAPADRSA